MKLTFERVGVGEDLVSNYARDFSPAVVQRCAAPVDKSGTVSHGNVYDIVRWYGQLLKKIQCVAREEAKFRTSMATPSSETR